MLDTDQYRRATSPATKTPTQCPFTTVEHRNTSDLPKSTSDASSRWILLTVSPFLLSSSLTFLTLFIKLRSSENLPTWFCSIFRKFLNKAVSFNKTNQINTFFWLNLRNRRPCAIRSHIFSTSRTLQPWQLLCWLLGIQRSARDEQ